MPADTHIGAELASEARIAELQAEIDALTAKVDSLSPHGSCACSYDRPGDVCLHHSPQLAAAIRERDEARTALAESKRRRVEAEAALQEWRSGIAELGRVWRILKREPARPTPKIRELFGATLTQETPDVTG